MKRLANITTLFVDIGGVLLTDGWPRTSRCMAAKMFHLDADEMESRHAQAFDTYELDKLTLEEYLNHVVFYEKRKFTHAQFQRFMFTQSKPYHNMIDLIRNLKIRYGVKIVVVSNEGRELNDHRIRTFQLNKIVDFFISSCFVHLRKPDPDIFRHALDMTQSVPEQTVYIENTLMFVRIAESLGIRSIYHVDHDSTCTKLALLGLGISK